MCVSGLSTAGARSGLPYAHFTASTSLVVNLVREVHAKPLIDDALANSHPYPAALAVRGADSDTLARDAHRADLATPAP